MVEHDPLPIATMTLTGVRITDFKGLTDCTIDELGRYNVIVGPNDAGKSSVAEAISIGTNLGAHIEPLRLSDSPSSQPWTVEFSFTNELADRSQVLRTRDSRHTDSDEMKRFTQDLRYHGPFERVSISNPAAATPRIGRFAENLAACIHYLQSNEPSIFESLRSSFADVLPKYRSIRAPFIDHQRTVGVVLDSETTSIPLSDVGDGIGRTLAWLTAMYTAAPGAFLMFDEPEVGLHPRLQRRLRRELVGISEQLNQQLLVLTNSPYWIHTEGRGTAYQVSNGTAQRVTDLGPMRRGLGILPADVGFFDLVLFPEGASERESLPYLFRAMGFEPEANGIKIVSLGGSRKKARLNEELDTLKQLGIAAAVAVDAADQWTQSWADERAAEKDLRLEPGDVTFWRTVSGDRGVFEDVFGADVLAAALNSLAAGDETEPPPELVIPADVETAISQVKTDVGLARLFRAKSNGGELDKPDLALRAAQICVEQGEIPQQVSDLVNGLRRRLEVARQAD